MEDWLICEINTLVKYRQNQNQNHKIWQVILLHCYFIVKNIIIIKTFINESAY